MKAIEEYINPHNPLEDEGDLFHAIMDECIDLEKGSIDHIEATIRISKITNHFYRKKAADVTKTIKPTISIKGDISPSELRKKTVQQMKRAMENMYENNNPREEAKMEKKELQQILEGNDDAVKEMEQVFKEHESIETVIVEPNSWVGKELLLQTKRLVDLQRDVHSLSTLIKK
ncbi:hypothetical protein ABNF65_21100 [Paenibacillus larvae]